MGDTFAGPGMRSDENSRVEIGRLSQITGTVPIFGLSALKVFFKEYADNKVGHWKVGQPKRKDANNKHEGSR